MGTQRAVSEWGNTFPKWLRTRPHSIPADEFFIRFCLLDFASASTVKDSRGYLLIVRVELIESGIQLLYVIMELLYCQSVQQK